MMGRIRKCTLGLLLPVGMLAGLGGCGTDHGDMVGAETDALGLLEPGIRALDNQLQSHYSAVTGILNAANVSTASKEGAGLEAAPVSETYGLTDEDWQALLMETQGYGQDMTRIMNDLGDTVTMIGTCQMMMGGMMFGSENGVGTCPCQPYMITSVEEIQQHLDEMLDWMELEDSSGLLEEMNSHRNLMRSHILDMGSHMRQTYGSRGGGGMGGMM